MTKRKKDQAAVHLGRKGGRATAKKWKSTVERKEIARKAALARWAKVNERNDKV